MFITKLSLACLTAAVASASQTGEDTWVAQFRSQHITLAQRRTNMAMMEIEANKETAKKATVKLPSKVAPKIIAKKGTVTKAAPKKSAAAKTSKKSGKKVKSATKSKKAKKTKKVVKPSGPNPFPTKNFKLSAKFIKNCKQANETIVNAMGYLATVKLTATTKAWKASMRKRLTKELN